MLKCGTPICTSLPVAHCWSTTACTVHYTSTTQADNDTGQLISTQICLPINNYNILFRSFQDFLTMIFICTYHMFSIPHRNFDILWEKMVMWCPHLNSLYQCTMKLYRQRLLNIFFKRIFSSLE